MTSADWGDAPEVRAFYGREADVDDLSAELLEGGRRLVLIQGMQGMGKTRLSLAAVRARTDGGGGLSNNIRQPIADRFDHVVWLSLLNAPSSDELLRQLTSALPGATTVPADGADALDLLLARVKGSRCLILLDNLESLLEGGEGSAFRAGTGDYGGVLARFARTQHESCIVLTTRETPARLAEICGPKQPACILQMQRLDSAGCGRILDDHGIKYGPDLLARIVDAFGGNPLALELTAKRMLEVHDGDAARMLEVDGLAFAEIRRLLDWHFDRLSPAELRLAHCLAIAREGLTIAEVSTDLGHASTLEVGDAIASIQQKMPLERRNGRFTLHAVLMEYATDRIVAQARSEVVTATAGLLDMVALCKARSKDYVRETQRRLILEPIVAATPGSGPMVDEASLGRLLDNVRQGGSTGFAAGNVLNLMWASGIDLDGRDFSGLHLRSAYLREVCLPQCNFTRSSFMGCAFATSLGAILAVAVDPQGKELISGDNHGDVRAWRTEDGRELRGYEGHSSWIRTIAFSPDGLTFATGSSDFEIRIWEKHSARCLQVLRGHSDQVYSVDFSPDGARIASGAEDGSVILWNAADGTRLATLKVRAGRARSVRFDPTGAMLAVASQDLELWDVAELRLHGSLRPPAPYIRRAVFDRSGSLLAYADSAGSVNVVDGSTLEELHVLAGAPSANWLEFSPDGAVLAAANEDGSIQLWSAGAGFGRLATLQGHSSSIRCIAFAPDSNLLVSAGEDRALRIWDLGTRLVLRTIRGYANGIRGVAWNGASGDIAAACEDGAVRLWRGLDADAPPAGRLEAHLKTVEAVAFDDDLGMVASASDDGTARLWNLASGRSTVLQGHRSWVWCVAFDAAGRRLATGGRDRRIVVWDAASGAKLVEIAGHDDEVHCVAFADLDRRLISGGDDSLIRIWDPADGRETRVVAGHGDCVRSIAYAREPELLASASDDGTVRLWSVEGDPLRVLKSHVGRVRSVAFGPGGMRLYSAGDDRLIRAWDVATGTCVAEYPGHDRSIWSIALDKAAARLVSGSEDGTLRILDLEARSVTVRWPERRYEGMIISGATGLEPGERASLHRLGAVDAAALPSANQPAGPPSASAPATHVDREATDEVGFIGRALIVAIANYDEANALPEAVLNDARDIQAALTMSDVGGYAPHRVQMLLDGAATLSTLRGALRRLADEAGPQDTVLIYFSGHGARIGSGEGVSSCLLPVDSRRDDRAGTGLSEREFSDALAAITSPRLLVVLDACHSGGAGQLKDGDAAKLEDGLVAKDLSRLAQGAGRVIISSSRAEEVSTVSRDALNSVFTEHFLRALEGAARDRGDGVVRVLDVFEYVVEKLKAARPPQHPVLKANDMEDNFPIALRKEDTQDPPAAAPPGSDLVDTLAFLYPQGPNENQIWTRAGGEVSRLVLRGHGHAMWFSALRALRQGGGGARITLKKLVAAALEDYPNNMGLKDADASLYRIRAR